MSNLVSNYKSEYTDETLTAQNEYTLLMRRSNMYEFIFLFIIALIVLVITIRNLTSDTTTTAGYVVCCIILVVFFIAIIAYVMQRIGTTSLPWQTYSGGGGSGPIIRIHYV
jgi:fumarate reductase subunit C